MFYFCNFSLFEAIRLCPVCCFGCYQRTGSDGANRLRRATKSEQTNVSGLVDDVSLLFLIDRNHSTQYGVIHVLIHKTPGVYKSTRIAFPLNTTRMIQD